MLQVVQAGLFAERWTLGLEQLRKEVFLGPLPVLEETPVVQPKPPVALGEEPVRHDWTPFLLTLTPPSFLRAGVGALRR